MSITPTYVYADEDDVLDLLGREGVDGRLDDDGTGAISSDESGYMTRFLRRATHKVNSYLLGAYEASELARSGIVNVLTATIAAYRLACRRGNPGPSSLKEEYDEALKELEELRDGKYPLADAGRRGSAFPSWANLNFSALRPLKKLRVETQISDSHDPSTGKRARDIAASYIVEPNG